MSGHSLGFEDEDLGSSPWLVGRYCSYLLPKQAGGTPQIIVDKTTPMTGRLRVYIYETALWEAPFTRVFLRVFSSGVFS